MHTLVVNNTDLSKEMLIFLERKTSGKMCSVFIPGLKNLNTSFLKKDIIFFCEDIKDQDFTSWDKLKTVLHFCPEFEKIVVLFEDQSNLNKINEFTQNPKIEFYSIYEKRSKSIFAHL